MKARQHLIAALSEDSVGGIATLRDIVHAEQLVDAHRAEVLREGAAELDRIADETEARVAAYYGPASGIGPGSTELVREAARALLSMAAGKSSRRGADTTPDFFQPGRTYQRRRWHFQCLAVAPNPFTGETRAVGFIYRLGENATVTVFGPDDWAHGGWVDNAEGGEAQ